MVARLIFIFLAMTIKIYSQDYIPFPFSNALWGTQWHCQDIQNEKIYRYTLSGEEIINELKYCELQVKLAELNSNNSPDDVPVEELEPVYYREENKRVYFYDKNLKEDILYYDFNLNVGDTFVYQKYDTLIVLEEAEYFGRKGLVLQTLNNPYLDSYWTVTWVQGIGSLNGLMNPIGDYGCSSELDCFMHDNFSPLDCSRNYYFLDIDETYTENFKINPNPASTRVNIKSNYGNINQIRIISLFNGYELFKLEDINSDNYSIDVSSLASGVYILIIYSNKKMLSKKLIVN